MVLKATLGNVRHNNLILQKEKTGLGHSRDLSGITQLTVVFCFILPFTSMLWLTSTVFCHETVHQRITETLFQKPQIKHKFMLLIWWYMDIVKNRQKHSESKHWFHKLDTKFLWYFILSRRARRFLGLCCYWFRFVSCFCYALPSAWDAVPLADIPWTTLGYTTHLEENVKNVLCYHALQ